MIQTDIAIVGAGPGGAATALRLSYLGIPSLLIDKAGFPRDKICGDAISGKVTTLLNRLDPAIMERFRTHFQPTDVWGIRFFPPSKKMIELPFRIGYEREFNKAPGYVSTRLDFDQFLIDEVRRRDDIDLRLHTEITDYERTDRGWRIRDREGKLDVECRLLVIGDGAHSQFSRREAGLEIDHAHHAAAVRQYHRGVTGFHPDNFIELHFLPEINPGYFWVFKLPNGMANVGLGMRSDIVKKRKFNLRKMLPQVIENNPDIKARFANAEALEPIKGYGLPLGSKSRTLSGDHFVLVGDAGHLIDPLTGEGIGNATYSGFIAAELFEKCLAADRFDAAFLADYDVRVDRVLRAEMRLSYKLQQTMQHVWLTNLLTGMITANPKIVEVLCKMYTDFELRKQLISPVFWFKQLFKRPKSAF